MSAVVDIRTWETYASGDPVLVDATKNIVAVTGAPTVQSASAIHGARGLKCHSGVTGGEAVTFGASASGACSYYGVIDTAGAGTATVGAVKNGSTFLARIRANPTGTKWDIADQSSTLQDDTPTTLYTVAQTFRHDVMWSYASGNITVTVRIFLGSNVEGFAPDATLGPVTFASSAIPNRFGIGTVNTAWSISFDTYRNYSDTAAWPVPYLSTAALSQRGVMEVSDSGWTIGTGTDNATNRVAAQSDESDSTYVQSAASGTSTERVWLGPGVTPDSAQVKIRADQTGSGATLHFKLYEGISSGVALEDITITVTGTTTDFPVAFSAGTVSAILDWNNLFYELVAA